MKDKAIQSPLDGIKGLKENWKTDIVSGFIIFLIALPLCIGIAVASGAPPVSGIFAGIVGGIFVSLFSGSYVTINGPAAGLIVIVLHAIDNLGMGDPSIGFKYTLAAIVCAGILQVIMGIFRSGSIVALFPASVIHGMLASIGIIIFSKQFHTALGVKPESKEVFDLILEIPRSISHLNPELALIGCVSLCILIVLPMIKNDWIKRIPAPLLVVIVAVILSNLFDISHEHSVTLFNHSYSIGPKDLVALPNVLLNGMVFPDFSIIFSIKSISTIIAIALVASLESLLTASAVDKLDPFKRRSNMNQELIAKGIGNTFLGFIGGIPIIAEVVRSSANITNGARTRWSNFFHGLFLLLFILLVPGLIQKIPLASLAAILMIVGYRLSSPGQFKEIYKVGNEQLVIFLSTIFFTLWVDLLVGIGMGILTKILVQFIQGVSPSEMFVLKHDKKVEKNGTNVISITGAATFSNYILLRRAIANIPQDKNIILDFSNSKFIDHTVMENLIELGIQKENEANRIIIKNVKGQKRLSEEIGTAKVH
ncbi:MAG: SulP family inorganic anion transporter [Leptospiraceae bacterium]|nr:SulP family inorganic anion transporter [Leptospiraceae bacterium]MCK6380655.1 SulP family inorganic anion transporter [Leptospiraceae bacterium]NUM41531.1 SulP family inorganic anion transporter [Leptospiraceae bacterium]